jgi:hypothetical protein
VSPDHVKAGAVLRGVSKGCFLASALEPASAVLGDVVKVVSVEALQGLVVADVVDALVEAAGTSMSLMRTGLGAGTG